MSLTSLGLTDTQERLYRHLLRTPHTDLPAAVLAHMLGIHITVAVAWQRASAGDWTAYAAEVSRRTPEGEHPDEHDLRD
ncbi:hypothetical protein ABT061_40875 [Streptosporangium sp. NPDC002544]|uniref:hypothetical protein n=1 Tax=Streptosporangium sp. NPDC002544 TaxID=3154538 RepID=UPI00332E6490